VPVINALSDRFHPCQALADVFTLQEKFGDLRGLKLAFVGDGNNVAHSLMLSALRLGVNFAIATPPGYEPDAEIVRRRWLRGAPAPDYRADQRSAGGGGAHAVYTDVWASMGQEQQKRWRADASRPLSGERTADGRSRPDAVFMHCLPAKRGEEVTDEVIESPQSVVFDQAENRLHAQKALLLMLLG
jgi:ornithine carbamoyltransferase